MFANTYDRQKRYIMIVLINIIVHTLPAGWGFDLDMKFIFWPYWPFRLRLDHRQKIRS